MELKKTLIIGASSNPERYSHRALRSLVRNRMPVVACGIHTGIVSGVEIVKPYPEADGIHTITLYISPARQPAYYDYISRIAPKRVIFNPGTENPELEQILTDKGVEVVCDCTLVMLANEEY